MYDCDYTELLMTVCDLGCVMTILISIIVEHMLQYCSGNSGLVTVFFYFDFEDTQKHETEQMLRSLLCQLLRRSVSHCG
jgi:hypothetical protein